MTSLGHWLSNVINYFNVQQKEKKISVSTDFFLNYQPNLIWQSWTHELVHVQRH